MVRKAEFHIYPRIILDDLNHIGMMYKVYVQLKIKFTVKMTTPKIVLENSV